MQIVQKCNDWCCLCFVIWKGTNMRAVRVQDLQTRLWYVVYVSVMLFWDVLGPGVETDGKNLPLSLVRGLIWSTTTCSAYLKHGFCIWFCMYVVFLVFTILPLYTYKANEIVGFWWQFRLADTSYIVHMLPKKIHPNAMCSELCECGNVTARDGATSC